MEVRVVEYEGFNMEQPEDEFALEELEYGKLVKCRSGGGKRDKFSGPYCVEES